MKVNLYCHSIAVDRSIKNSIDVLIFGGKETQDPDSLNSKKISVASHFMSLDTVSGLMTPVCTDTLPPSNRYLQHIFFLFTFIANTSLEYLFLDGIMFICRFLQALFLFLDDWDCDVISQTCKSTLFAVHFHCFIFII